MLHAAVCQDEGSGSPSGSRPIDGRPGNSFVRIAVLAENRQASALESDRDRSGVVSQFRDRVADEQARAVEVL